MPLKGGEPCLSPHSRPLKLLKAAPAVPFMGKRGHTEAPRWLVIKRTVELSDNQPPCVGRVKAPTVNVAAQVLWWRVSCRPF